MLFDHTRQVGYSITCGVNISNVYAMSSMTSAEFSLWLMRVSQAVCRRVFTVTLYSSFIRVHRQTPCTLAYTCSHISRQFTNAHKPQVSYI